MNNKILEEINKMRKNTLMETLNIKYIEIGENFLIAKMPITKKIHQPFGLLHGGATIALAESVGSMLSYYVINNKKLCICCIEISANHFISKQHGIIFAKARLIYKGKKIHFIQTKIFDIKQNIISQCKMTNFILNNERNRFYSYLSKNYRSI